MDILVTGAFPLAAEEKLQLEAAGHTVLFQADERAAVENPERFEAVVCNGLFLHNPIESFTSLRLIQLTSAGFDRVPVDYIREKGIRLFNAKGVYSIPMAEFAVSAILQLYKKASFFAQNRSGHLWRKNRDLLELHEKKVCIVGTGEVGRRTARLLKVFGCRITGVNRTVRSLECFDAVLPLDRLTAVASEADILLCCLALTPETEGILDREVFSRLKQGAVFVNLSRGAIADETALLEWLRSGRSGGAALDVFKQEPLDVQHPLWDLDNVLLTPHNSFVADGNHDRLWNRIKENLL